jgi:DNA-binding HxlR family transcriptional regulator
MIFILDTVKGSCTMESGALADHHTLCPIARAQAIVGDRWTVLILRELFMGSRRFEQLQCQAGVTPQMLATRLKKLETLGLLERRAYSTRPLRHEYVLTPMGLAFHPVLLALRAWGETWFKAADEAVAVRYLHRPCGQDPGLGPACQGCGRVMRREDLAGTFDEAYATERDKRWARFKAG